MLRLILPIAIGILATTSIAHSADEVDLKRLRRERPRLFLPDLDLPQLKRAIATDPQLSEWHSHLTAAAEKMLTEKPVERVLIGPRLLSKSKLALNRISLLAAMYRLDGNERFADRAIEEMLAVCAFEDWNPSHFLDVAEMTNGVAIGYDWLHDRLTSEQRTIIRTAIVEKGLKPGLERYRGATTRSAFWVNATHNWNQVCNGGLTVGALAIADEEPEIAQEVLNRARESLPRALASYAPDGGWVEGPGYWGYATQYTAFYLAAVQSALGTDLDLSKMAGLSRAGEFRMHSIGPIGLTFNYADGGANVGLSPAMFYLAHAFDRPDYAAHEVSMIGKSGGGWEALRSGATTRPNVQPNIFHLLWSPSAWKGAEINSTTRLSAAAMPADRDALFRAIHVAYFRSAWDDPDALFVGFKGGDNKANHAHLDLGSFVLDALGERWAVDLGADDYNLPAYFGKNRGTYYRQRTEGHNTLTVGTDNQVMVAKAPIVAFSSKLAEAYAVVDLRGAYVGSLRSAKRGIMLFGSRRRVLVQDDVETDKPVDLVWNFHTPARIDVYGATATLKLGDEELTLRILEPPGAAFEVVSSNPPPPQRQQPDVKNLVIKLPGVSGQVRIAVMLTPGETKGERPPDLRPLDVWIADSPVLR